MNNTPTPETDAEEAHRNDAYEFVNAACWTWVVPANFARRLERQLNAVQDVKCIGRGTGDGCGQNGGQSGGTCPKCGGMLLSLSARYSADLDAARARVAELERYQTTIFKALDILQCGHVDNVVGALQTFLAHYSDAMARIATLEAECERLKHERNRAGMDARKEMMDSIKAAQNQTPLDRPDKPGWWWKWTVDRWLWWEICEHDGLLVTWSDDGLYHDAVENGQWFPATPPPAPGKKGAK